VIHVDHVHDPDGWWAYTVTEAPAPSGSVPPVAATHLLVDNYSGGFVRVRPAGDTPTTVDFALATSPGPGGALYPSAADISGSAAVWADFSGNLGHLRMADGTDVTGALLKEWIRRGAVYNVTKDSTDPAHPNLIVGAEVPPPPPADVTSVKVSSAGHGPTANPEDGAEVAVTFMLMVGPTPPPPPPAAVTRIDPEALLAHLGLAGPADQRAVLALAAAEAWAQRRRSRTSPDDLFTRPDALAGTVIYAGLLYLSRAQPQGFPGFDVDLGSASEETAMAMANAMRLVGQDVVVA
jgi:hypothetical protein